jgi:hypothetical protein
MANIKVKVDTRQLEKNLKKITPVIQRNTARYLKTAIPDFIRKGVSPVKGRFQKYSESYRDAIKGKTAFWTSKNGKIQSISTVSNKDLKSLRASTDARKQNRANKDFIKQHNSHLSGKKVSPVNLTLTGKMLNSFKVKIRNNKISLFFSDKKAAYHNNGTDKIPRRAMLPTESGEEFNRNITLRIREVVSKSIKQVLG